MFDVFSLVNRARIVRETRDGRMQEVEIELSDWVFQAVEAQEVLTLDRRYFQLAKPLERRLYELARKHCGSQENFRIGIEKLRLKCGSQSTTKEFRRLLQTILADDARHDHMPGYQFILEDEMVEVRHKDPAPQTALPASPWVLPDEIYERARELAPGWDIYALETDWQDWLAKASITPRNVAAHFLAFCKRRGRYPGFTE